MKGSKKDMFDTLFENERAQEEVSYDFDEKWIKTEIDLERKEFYSFSVFKFNVFYALAIGFNTLVCLGLLGQALTNMRVIHETKIIERIYVDQPASLKNDEIGKQPLLGKEDVSIDFSKRNNRQLPEIKDEKLNPKKSELHPAVVQKTSDSKEDESVQVIQKKTKTKEEVLTESRMNNKKSEEKHETIVIELPPDTIFEIDTVKVNKRNYRKNH